MKNLFLIALLIMASENAFAFEVTCKITDGTKQKSNEAPSALGTTTTTTPSQANQPRAVPKTTNLLTQTPPERCQQRKYCVTVDESMPQKQVLCDAGYSIILEAYTDNMLIHVVEASSRRDLVKASAPIKGFSSLSLVNEKPEVAIQCDLTTDANRECK